MADSPGRARSIGGRSSTGNALPDPRIVAIEPGGRRAIIHRQQPAKPYVRQVLDLIRLNDLRVLDTISTGDSDGLEGDWRGDHVAALNFGCCGGSNHPYPRLSLFTVSENRLTPRGTPAVDAEDVGIATQNQPYLGQPRFLDRRGRRVGVWLYGGVRSRWLDCDLRADRYRSVPAGSSPVSVELPR